MAASRDVSFAMVANEVGYRALHQPPFRPLAPKPGWRASMTAIDRCGSISKRWCAVHNPVKPAPTIATSHDNSLGRQSKFQTSCPFRQRESGHCAKVSFTKVRLDQVAQLGVVNQTNCSERSGNANNTRCRWRLNFFHTDWVNDYHVVNLAQRFASKNLKS